MPYIRRSPVWPDPRVKPPYGAAEIDKDHPLASGLRFYSILDEGGGLPLDMVTGSKATTNAGAVWQSGSKGVELAYTEPSRSSWADRPSYNPADRLTVACLCSRKATAEGDIAFGKWNSNTGNALFVLALDAGGTLMRFFINAGGVSTGITGVNTMAVGVPTLYCGTYDGATMSLYKDAVLDVSVAKSGALILAAQTLRIGWADNEAATDGWNGSVIWAGMWGERALTHSDVTGLLAEPYAFLRPIIRRRYFLPAVGGLGWKITGRRARLAGHGGLAA